jgi:hypothetical protein
MWELPDVFTGDPFTAITLTQKINNVPYTPQLLGSMGIFQADGVRTTDIAIAERNGVLDVIATSERGAPPEEIDHAKDKMRKATAVHLALQAYANADEVQNALSYAQGAGIPSMAAAEELLDDRLNGPFGLRARIELTHEYHRLGAIKGIVLDKDGSTELYNWFSFFGISPLADHNTVFGSLTADGAVFEMECAALVRDGLREMEGLPVALARPVVLAGDNYYDQVYGNKEVKAARKNRDAGRDSDVFGENKAFSAIDYGGITWANYRGTKDGAVGIGTDEARLFFMGVPGAFQVLFAPPDIMGMTNMKGLPVHAFMPPEKQTSRRATVEAQSNPLWICTRPKSLRRLTKS